MKHLDSPGLLFQLKTYFMCLYLVYRLPLPLNNLKISSVVKAVRSISFHLKALSYQFHPCVSHVLFSALWGR